jgi:hypothetical protein
MSLTTRQSLAASRQGVGYGSRGFAKVSRPTSKTTLRRDAPERENAGLIPFMRNTVNM